MKKPDRTILFLVVAFFVLGFSSCGPFGGGPWYLIYDSLQDEEDDENVEVIEILSGPYVTDVTDNEATIEWTTDRQSDSTVQYGTTGAYGLEANDPALRTVHSMPVEGLEPNTTYYFRVISSIGETARGISQNNAFTTRIRLTIISSYGSATPEPGAAFYKSGTEVVACVDQTAPGPSKTRYRCTGWSGEGSVPVSGNECDIIFSITQNSTITWNWVTQYCITGTANPIGSGTVFTDPPGEWHDEGTSPQLTAAANTGYDFVNWTGDLTGSVNPNNLFVDSPKTVVANFSGMTYNFTVYSDYGSPNPAVGSHTCGSGALIEASVNTPISGGTGLRYACTGWTGTGDVDPTGTTNSTSFTITQDSEITWEWKTQYLLSTYISPGGAGSVSRSPDASWYDASTVVQMTASENAGFSFANWSGDLTGSTNPDSITMDSAKTVTANFTGGGTFWTLTVNSAYGSPDPTTGSVADGTLVDASVDSPVDGTPGTRYTCTGWTGTGDVPSSGSNNSVSFTIYQDSSITWTWKTQYELTTAVSPVGGGTVARNPNATWYDSGLVVGLTAEPSASYVFSSWSGDLSGSTNPENITMDGPKSVTATFATGTCTLTVASDYGSPVPPVGDNDYTIGASVSASVDSHVSAGTGIRNTCTGWSGTGSVPSSGATNSVNFNIAVNSSITWNWKTQYELAVASNPPSGGDINLLPAGGWYDLSTSVGVTAVPDPAYDFDHWEGDLAGSVNPENITIDSAKSVTACFTIQSDTILVPADYTTIQEALDACVEGGTVLVSDGTYTGVSNKDLSFNGKALELISENGPGYCIIDCEDQGRGFYFNSNEQDDSVVCGFTIRNGYASSGAGISISSGSNPTIENCIIEDCEAYSNGGAISCSGSLTLSNCEIKGNLSKGIYGGALYLNSSSPDARIENCRFSDNEIRNDGNFHLGEYGGGAIAILSCSPVVSNCLFFDNYSYKCHGGAIYIDGGAPLITNCTISKNSVGGVSGTRGGGIFARGGSTATIANCISYGNLERDIYEYGTNPITLENCCYADIYGSDYTISNCTSSDPDFIYSPLFNFRLNTGSPCINSGNNNYVNAGDKDLEDRDRIIDSTVDMGCHEYRALDVPSSYATIQAAIDASEDGDTVLVADGTYNGTGNRALETLGKIISVRSINGPASCVIDCENAARGFYIHAGETNHTIISGFTIRNGTGDKGGGIYIYKYTHPMVSDCVITTCSAVNLGGGISLYKSESLVLDCNIINNHSSEEGGGINMELSSPTLVDCLVTDNTSTQYGAGIRIYDFASKPELVNCVISGNEITGTAGYMGGGIYITSGASPTLKNCLIYSNEGKESGGGIYSFMSECLLKNCTIASNNAQTGGGVSVQMSSDLDFINCIISENTATTWRQVAWSSSSSATAEYCCFPTGLNEVDSGVSQFDCILDNPLFVVGPGGNYYLSHVAAGQGSDSPCIDAGSNSAYIFQLDSKTTRTDGTVDSGTVDMGYHYEP